MRTLATIPLQALTRAKSRLSSLLDATQRQQLVLSLAQHTIDTLQRIPGIEKVLVVTPDPQIATTATRWGALAVLQAEPGLNRAIRAVQHAARQEGYSALLIVLGDLPLLAPGPVRNALALLEPRGVVLAPDRHGTGTNLLALAPPGVIEPAFGEHSRRRHRLAAVRARCTLRELWAWPLALDVDTAADLELAGIAAPREGS
ncbi:MAG: 2-phospho-L-lactate guanylyltransferase [Thermomicrobium sp.]|nr:2-phospho-L-lactate guanylyltransferase [Thermomicrobium sp.]MDW8059361.1 2-phospho-L-lactate guanylyltransferase [Thermomicrobium sp.]